nr:mechanosensitive ion channel family protein [Altererythrobacter sp. KTW20L]
MALGFVALLPQLVLALVVVFLTWIVARFAVRIAEMLTGRSRLRPDLQKLVETLVRVAVWIIGLLLAAAVAIPGFTPAGMIAGLGIGALAIGFAFQDIFENFLAGILIMLRDKMNLGDYVEADGISGNVEKITLRETHIRQFSGELTILPNATVFKNPVKIFSDAPERRDSMVVGVSYDSDLERSAAVIHDAVASVAALVPGRPVEVFGSEFNSSSVDFNVRWWTNTKENNILVVRHEVILAIKAALDQAGIEIPFPYVTHTFKESLPLERPRKAA